MLEPRTSRTPVLAGAASMIMAVFVLTLAAALAFSIFGWAFHVLFFVARLAVISALIVIGLRLLMRSHR